MIRKMPGRQLGDPSCYIVTPARLEPAQAGSSRRHKYVVYIGPNYHIFVSLTSLEGGEQQECGCQQEEGAQQEISVLNFN